MTIDDIISSPDGRRLGNRNVPGETFWIQQREETVHIVDRYGRTVQAWYRSTKKEVL